MPDAIAPVLMLDIDGTELTAEDRELLAHPATGGLIFFTRNYEDRAQLCALVDAVRAVRPDILIAVDQEGGRVQRFRDGFTRLPPMAALGALYARDRAEGALAARQLGALMASELVDCGIDISFAPVLDLDFGHSEVIGDRAFGREPGQVVALAGAFIDGMADAGMAATGKHFPGHGHVAADSHLELPVDERSLADIRAQDLLPFKHLAARLKGIMPAHVVYTAADDNPAGFSRFWLQDVLRQELGFKGVIFSDDLAMAGAAFAGDYPARARAALGAGCDMVLVCNDRAGAVQVAQSLEQWQPDASLVAATTLSASQPSSSLALADAQARAQQLLG
jgi:beta-N-acetylhexosaminidase